MTSLGCVSLAALVIGVLAAPARSAPGDEPTRAARSVHLGYVWDGEDVNTFYNELTVERSVPGSYFMCCGFAGGYFGIQELEEGRKIVLFSVWDPNGSDHPQGRRHPEQVQATFQSPDVTIKRFGGEGTGLQCLFKYDWEAGKTYCFAVRAQMSEGTTSYAAYFRAKDSGKWVHLATYRRADARALHGLYSFIEDFRRDVKSAAEMRRARFDSPWVMTRDGRWARVYKAKFTASGAPWEAKDTIDAGVSDDGFYLQTGGETRQHTKLRDLIEMPEADAGNPPQVPVD